MQQVFHELLLGGLRFLFAAIVFCRLASLQALGQETLPDEIQLIDLDADRSRQVIVDREVGVYLGHPTTLLLEDQKTILCVYPKGHGKGEIIYKRSADAGKTWSERIATPDSWKTSGEVPTIHRVVDAKGKRRVILFSGLYPARMAVSEDDGESWSELQPVGTWGGIVVMGSLTPLRTGPGNYMALFHDDGRFIAENATPKRPAEFTLYKVLSEDGGLTWSRSALIHRSRELHLCEPGIIRSPDGRQLCVLLRENSRRHRSQVIFSNDEGETWSAPRDLPDSLNGDRHTAKYSHDGRLLISFRRRVPSHLKKGPFEGDWVAWVGKYQDVVDGNEGQFLVRLKDNLHAWDCAYPGVEITGDGTFILTTYGHWERGEKPYIISLRLKLNELK